MKFKKEKLDIFVSEKDDGAMNLARDGSLSDNAIKFLRTIGISDNFAYMRQTHSAVVKYIDNAGVCVADGIIAKNNLAVGVRSADCVPLMLALGEYVAAVHISRENLIGGIISNLSRELTSLGVDLSRAEIFLGPHIRAKNYEIKLNVIDSIKQTGFSNNILHKDDKAFFDLTTAVTDELARVGFNGHNIIDCMIDTYEADNLFSYRRCCSGDNDVKTFFTIISANVQEKS